MRFLSWNLAAGIVPLLAACNHPTAGGFPPAGLEIVAGDSQVRSAGRPVRVAPTVRVTDADGHPLAGVPVTFAGVRTAVVSPPVVVTDRDGLAALPDWTLRTDGGEDTLVAKVEGVDPLRLTATSLAVVDVSVNDGVSCVLLTEDRAACWGGNGRGQLATGDTMEVHRPTLVRGGLPVAAVVPAPTQMCVLARDSAVYCAGAISRAEPRATVLTEVGGGMKFRQITVLGGPRCGVAEDDAAYCWGPGMYYVASDGSLAHDPTVPVRLPASSSLPIRLVDGDWASDAFEGAYNACALDAGGRAQCWDLRQYTAPWYSLSAETYDAISVGGYTVCGRTAESVSCWARAYPSFPNTPVALGPVSTVDVSQTRACAVAVTGGIYCWDYTLVPRIMPGTEQRFYTRLSISNGHACAIDAQGALWCWGWNDHGQLGDGTTTNAPRPVRVLLDF